MTMPITDERISQVIHEINEYKRLHYGQLEPEAGALIDLLMRRVGEKATTAMAISMFLTFAIGDLPQSPNEVERLIKGDKNPFTKFVADLVYVTYRIGYAQAEIDVLEKMRAGQ